jgi:hypothetical protein
VIDVPHDGNCFYAALTVLLNLDISEYSKLKKQMSAYCLSHSEKYADWGNTQQLAQEISQEGKYASYRAVRVAADYLQRPLHLYVGSFPDGRLDNFHIDGG